MKLYIISGRSGSGKSTALHALEDMGLYCVDNLPVGLLPELIHQIEATSSHKNIETSIESNYDDIAVGIDARNLPSQLAKLPDVINSLHQSKLACEIIFLDADDTTLLQRFSETRRKHPLSNKSLSLKEALAKERSLLEPIANVAQRTILTSHLSLHQLRDQVKQQVFNQEKAGLSLLFYSFGFKNGLPLDADLVYDVRCLPNPHWIANLRPHTGLEAPVIEYLEQQPLVQEMYNDIQQYLDRWLPQFIANNRSYMTIAIGCTGGQHRSVYLANRLAKHYITVYSHTLVRHRELM